MKIVLADSNELVRVGLRTVLNTIHGVTIVGEAKSKHELLEQINDFDVNIVMIDYTASGFDIDVIPTLLQQKKNLKVLAITPEQSAQTLVNALKATV